ncbi:hypothetical protein VTI74DRAFT_3743 [Chaetomium olivicolor]
MRQILRCDSKLARCRQRMSERRVLVFAESNIRDWPCCPKQSGTAGVGARRIASLAKMKLRPPSAARFSVRHSRCSWQTTAEGKHLDSARARSLHQQINRSVGHSLDFSKCRLCQFCRVRKKAQIFSSANSPRESMTFSVARARNPVLICIGR